MFWLELLIVVILANVFGAAFFTVIKAHLSHKVYPRDDLYKLHGKEYLETVKKIDTYIYGESRIEQVISVVSLGIFIVPFVVIKKLPSAIIVAWHAFWEEVFY